MESITTETHLKFMAMALEEAKLALAAGEFPVGCVITGRHGEVLASGARRNSSSDFCEMDHAEIVALRNLQRSFANINPEDVTVYTTMEPCLMCFATLIVNGIRRMVYAYEDVMGGGTSLDLQALAPLYSSISNLEVVGKVLRQESLELFRQFFASAEHGYLAGTLLATYTLNQAKEP